MPERSNWTRNQLLIAFSLYCRLPFGQLHQSNREITRFAKLLGRTPSALAMKLSNIASLDPAITSTGRKGLSAASRADKSMWDEMVSDWDKFANHVHAALSEISDTSALDGIQIPEVTSSVDYTGGTKSSITTTRIGQDFFRKAVLSSYEYQCCISGLAVPKLLVASHIVPWRDDASIRLNPSNGLCLSMLVVSLFLCKSS